MSTTQLSIAHVVASLNRSSGGPSWMVTHLTDALAGMQELEITLLAQSDRSEAVVTSMQRLVKRRVIESYSAFGLMFSEPLRKSILSWPAMQKPDVLHGHGLWHPVNHWTAHVARRWNRPLILHTHGMLEPWALHHKGFKKRLSLWLYQQRDLTTARVLVATAWKEYANLRAFGLHQPIAIIPNGVFLPAKKSLLAPVKLSEYRVRTLLFLGRVYPVKGLLNLIDAWSQLRPIGWRLLIAGPDEGGHLAEVLARASKAGVSDSIDYLGVVDGDQKTTLYQSADLFVLPSFSENFGLVVAEALAHGLPVIATHGAPWSDLPVVGCGWWIPVGVEPLTEALHEAISLSDAERAVMGEQGMTYVRRYDWTMIAEEMAAVYRWVLGKGDRPDCIRLD